MEKHSAYFNLLEALRQDPDCPICGQTAKAMRGFLDSYLYEGVVDDGHWNRLVASSGWCARHAHALEGFSDGLAVSLFYRHLLRLGVKALSRPKNLWQRWFASKPLPCPACEHETQMEAGLLRLLTEAAGEQEFWEALCAHSGPCLPHAQALVDGSGHLIRARRAELILLLQAKLEALCAELDEFVRKSDHQSSERMGAEAGAWKRALRRTYGPRY